MAATAERIIFDWPVRDAPVAVVDIETTGLHPRSDRVVEISVVRVDPGEQPRVVLDTLVNPERGVTATEIHGITDADVADAPTFGSIAGPVALALSGAVVAAYNVYFDVRFLESEFDRLGLRELPPHVCLMYLRPMLGLGKKCCLSEACRAHGIDHHDIHIAVADAIAGARLWRLYQDAMAARGVRTFRDLARLKAYKFVDSFSRPPMSTAAGEGLGPTSRLKSRYGEPIAVRVGPPSDERRAQLAEYWDGLMAAVADLEITDMEVMDLNQRRLRLGITVDQLRALHGRVFAAALAQALEDSLVSDAEWQRLSRLHSCLAKLGWAPGT